MSITVINPEKSSELSVIADKIDIGLQAFEKLKSELIELRDQASGLKITSIDDKETINKVSVNRKKLKAARVEIEKEAKGMRDPLTKISKFISEKEKELVAIIEPAESDYDEQETWVENERDKRKQAAIDARLEQLSFTGKTFDRVYIGSLDKETFDIILNSHKEVYEKEQAAKAEAEKLRAEEAERIKAERAELEKIRAEQEKSFKAMQLENYRKAKEHHEREVALQAEKQKLDEDKLAAELDRKRIEVEKQREIELEQARKDAAEKARLQAIEDARLEAETKERELQEAKEKEERRLALQPDKEKLKDFALQLGDLTYFQPSDHRVRKILGDVHKMISDIQSYIHGKINEL